MGPLTLTSLLSSVLQAESRLSPALLQRRLREPEGQPAARVTPATLLSGVAADALLPVRCQTLPRPCDAPRGSRAHGMPPAPMGTGTGRD